MLILYLTSNARVNLLDFLDDELELPVKKLVGQFSLLSFVVRDMRHFSHVRYVALDRAAITEPDDELVQALLSYLTIYDMRVILIAEGLPMSSPFMQRLTLAGLLNIVTATEIEEIQTELRACFSEDGMQRFKPLFKSIPLQEVKPSLPLDDEQYRFGCTNITIAIAGCDRRVGVTTTAFNLTCWINAHGGTACYLEANTGKHLAHIIQLFKPDKRGNAYVMDHIDLYFTPELNQTYNFIVIDCGTLSERTLKDSFVNADVRILCGSAMPYELPVFYKAMDRCKELSTQALGLFVPEDLKPYLVQSISKDILFGNNSHDLFDPNVNGHFHKKVLEVFMEN
ncbi:hypothetical protein [Paenibacillus antibioticophila]|uniref:hypothetical protein n=1 Tax=Paenibacillus antibioticophila TaxID=1274374 RepID=UPI000A6CBC76|nr:hypothetical protein [Paenibacillus antibioticophila]